jgi:hypothetical protein
MLTSPSKLINLFSKVIFKNRLKTTPCPRHPVEGRDLPNTPRHPVERRDLPNTPRHPVEGRDLQNYPQNPLLSIQAVSTVVRV